MEGQIAKSHFRNIRHHYKWWNFDTNAFEEFKWSLRIIQNFSKIFAGMKSRKESFNKGWRGEGEFGRKATKEFGGGGFFWKTQLLTIKMCDA